MWSTPKPKLNYWDLSDQVRCVTKTRQENDITDCICVVYIEIEIELLGPIESSTVCYQNQIGQ